MNFRLPVALGRRSGILLLLLLLLPFSVNAQPQRGLGGRRGGGNSFSGTGPNLSPLDQAHIAEMQKAISPAFPQDVFNFARLIYPYDYRYGRMWDDDSPAAELNLEWRLYQITSLKVHPGYTYINIVPSELAKYPFIYMTGKVGMDFTNAQARDLRQYLLNGGFMMVEDFWGPAQWSYVYQEIKKIFPDREPVLLGLEHPIFHAVFDFKFFPQMPSAGYRNSGQSWDYTGDDENDHDPHYFAIYDDKNRMVMLICQNNHYGDGWEHEGDDNTYFERYSKAQAYPMFINILFYVMTH
jgi:hypothetical protein